MRLMAPLTCALLASACADECYPVPACDDRELASPELDHEPFDWSGSGTVVSVGPTHLTVDFDGTEHTVRLPAQPQVAVDETVTVAEGAISAGGQTIAVVRRGSSPSIHVGDDLPLGAVTATQVPTCKSEGWSGCGDGDVRVVYALEIGDVRVEPGETTTITTSDGRTATVANTRANDYASCGDQSCLRLFFGVTDVAIVYHD
jgi:hypothetical protein